jgi:hypothetical protein
LNPTIYSQEGRTVIDTMALAEEAFLFCRLGSRRAGPALKLLVQAFDGVDQTGYLEVEVSTSALASITPIVPSRTIDPLAQRQCVRDLPPEQQRILRLIRASVIELNQVCSSNPTQKVLQSVGYALHVLPDLVRRGGFDVNEFRGFNFRVAAYAWSNLSVAMRRVLCELANTSPDRVERLVVRDGFAIKIYTDRSVPISEMGVVDDTEAWWQIEES